MMYVQFRMYDPCIRYCCGSLCTVDA